MYPAHRSKNWASLTVLRVCIGLLKIESHGFDWIIIGIHIVVITFREIIVASVFDLTFLMLKFRGRSRYRRGSRCSGLWELLPQSFGRKVVAIKKQSLICISFFCHRKLPTTSRSERKNTESLYVGSQWEKQTSARKDSHFRAGYM